LKGKGGALMNKFTAAVQAGAIPTDPDDAYNLNACAGVSKTR